MDPEIGFIRRLIYNPANSLSAFSRIKPNLCKLLEARGILAPARLEHSVRDKSEVYVPCKRSNWPFFALVGCKIVFLFLFCLLKL